MQLLQNGKTQFIDSGGLPLANGSVGFYAPGTLNPLTTYQDQGGTIQNTNPIALDSRGQAIVWGTGTYRQIVKDASGVTIWDQLVASPDVAAVTFQGNLADTVNAANGDALVGVLQPFTGATAQTQHRKNQDLITAFDFMTGAQIADVQARTLSVDVTGALQAAAATGKSFWLPDGSYKITGTINLNSNQTVFMSAGVVVRQYTPNTTIFNALQTDNTWVIGNGAVLYGDGTSWSNTWTGNSGHNDIGVALQGCTRSGIAGVAFKNFAASAIRLWGGKRLRVVNFSIEGTNTYSTPLPVGSNFQNGIYMRDDATYGACDKIVITDGDISGTAQGILRENYGSTAANLGTVYAGLNIHDIPGQHGFYLQTGAASGSGIVLSNIGGSGVKFQSADANQAINGCAFTGVTGKVIGTSLFEINCTGTGSTNDVFLQGAADQAVNGLSVSGTVRDLRCDMELTNVGSNAVLIQGDGAKDFDVRVTAQTVGGDGILITGTTATGLRFWPRLRECNNANTVGAGISGIRVASVSANVDLYDPDVTDVNVRMQYGLFNQTLGSIVKVHGSATFTGASDTAVRTTGYIEEWPTEVNLLGNNGDFTNPNTVRSSQTMIMRGNTQSASNSVIWARDLIAGQTYKVEAEIAWMRGDNSDRKCVRSVVLVYVNAGAAVIQGSPVESESIAAAGVAGVYSWAASGLQIQLLISSGAVTTYRWGARVTVTKSGL